MAKGIKIGAKVRVLRGSFAARSGIVQGSEGTGRGRKWVVALGSGVLERFAARSLQLEGRNQPSASLAQPVCLAQAREDSRDSNVSSNDSSSSEDEEMLDPGDLGETSGTNDASEP